MKRLAYILLVGLLMITACSGDAAKELYETASFEELQNNHSHAVRLYSQIVEKYPESDYARMSKERLAEMKR